MELGRNVTGRASSPEHRPRGAPAGWFLLQQDQINHPSIDGFNLVLSCASLCGNTAQKVNTHDFCVKMDQTGNKISHMNCTAQHLLSEEGLASCLTSQQA